MTNNDYYFIDTIKDVDSGEVFYYVIHQKPDGRQVAVDRAFRNYHSAQELMEELNDDLYSSIAGTA